MNAPSAANTSALQRYYRIHAWVYDATRWSFLFGRKRIIQMAAQSHQPKTILEVGCGTGKNIQSLLQVFPDANITGLDLSSDMLAIAQKKFNREPRVNLLEQKFDRPITDDSGQIPTYDLVLFSYALSMFNPGWDIAIDAARQQLSDHGVIAVVDFAETPLRGFQQWMRVNHVEMQGHLKPRLEQVFQTKASRLQKAYAGLWQYHLFIGEK